MLSFIIQIIEVKLQLLLENKTDFAYENTCNFCPLFKVCPNFLLLLGKSY